MCQNIDVNEASVKSLTHFKLKNPSSKHVIIVDVKGNIDINKLHIHKILLKYFTIILFGEI